MIAVIGDALMAFHLTKEGAYTPWVGGSSMNVAAKVGSLGSSCAFFGKISADRFGSVVLEFCVNNHILFDPDLCNSPFGTTLCFPGENPSWYAQNTCSTLLTSEELLASFHNNSDIKIAYIGSESLALDGCSEAILDALSLYRPRPVIFLDMQVQPQLARDREHYRECLMRASGMADIIKVDFNDLAFLYPGMEGIRAARRLGVEMQCHILLGQNAWYSHDGFNVPVPASLQCDGAFVGALLSYLHDNGCFGNDGELPQLKTLEAKTIEDAFAFARKGKDTYTC
ncbi:MAG: PfkB family carbohydrate kinase [Sphaerochaetaceae bacterium]